jgi:catechol 2,3-dioxygenase-like lactoylglutathione lyase family enzyme
VKLIVVLRARDVDATRTFYEGLGLIFVEERHGTGPRHFAADAGAWVLEIYPARGTDSDGAIELGLDGTIPGRDPDGRVLVSTRRTSSTKP